MSQESKVVLVTGASAGIGEATAVEYAKLGYKVAITGRNQERLNKVLDKLVTLSPNKSRDNFLALNADFEDPVQVEPVVDKTVNKFGKLDIVINNAGFPGQKRQVTDPDFYEDYQRILQVNLLAPTRIAQLAVPHLLKTKGVIINVSSVADRIAVPTISYSVSKAGLTMLTRTLANALNATGIRVVTISPGPIVTNFEENLESYGPLTSLMRSGRADEVASTIVFLSSDKASYIHGCTIDIDGGCYAKFGGVFTKLAENP